MTAVPPPGAREQLELYHDWVFISSDSAPEDAVERNRVSLPHRWPADRKYADGWYIMRVPLQRRAGERIFARFDAVALLGVLFVNGIECGRHSGSYTPFDFDVTDALQDGPNVLALYVHDASAALVGGRALHQIGPWWPTRPVTMAGGIVGGIRLERRAAFHVANVFVKTSTRRQEMTLECEVTNAGPAPLRGRLDFAVYEWPGGARVDLAIPPQGASLAPGAMCNLKVVVPWKDARQWSPDHPNLYVLRTALTTDGTTSGGDILDTRFGFREFWVEGTQFMLNGTPIRLRGESHYSFVKTEECADPVRGRDLNREVCQSLKQRFRGNASRVHASIGPGNVALGADEAGLLLINQSAIWSLVLSRYTKGGEEFLANTRQEFAEWVRRDRNSPSVVIWDVENEQIRMNRDVAKSWAMKLDGFVREHDDTRPIEHSGAGWYDADQEIIHVHMEEHYTALLEMWRERGARPLIMGEFWIGGRGSEERLTSSAEVKSAEEASAEEARLYEVALLEMRYFGVSGIMPFQISRVVPGIARMPVAAPDASNVSARVARVHHGMQPETIFFWPRVESAPAGGNLQRELVVCNDSELAREVVAEWSLGDSPAQQIPMTLKPGEQRRIPVVVRCPPRDSQFTAKLREAGEILSSDVLPVRAAAAEVLAAPKLGRRLVIYEGEKPGAAVRLQELGLAVERSAHRPVDAKGTIWIIAPGASDRALNRQNAGIRDYLEQGGRLLCLAQEQWPAWSPIKLGFWTAIRPPPTAFAEIGFPEGRDQYFSCHAPIYAAAHPIFAGITASDLRWWSPRDGRVSDDALIRPASFGTHAKGAWRMLAGGTRLELGSIAEARVGEGTLLLCQAHVLEQRATAEARAVLMNMLRYLDGPAWTAGARVRLAGAATAEELAALTGASLGAFQDASAGRGEVLIATDGAAIGEMAAWAEAGGTVLVLSGEVAARLPACAVAGDGATISAAARGHDHPLLWGVSSTNFIGGGASVDGMLTAHPEPASVLFHGRSRMDSRGTGRREASSGGGATGAMAVGWRDGKGQWIVTTMAPWRGRTPQDAELLSTLVANAGIVIPAPRLQPSMVQVYKTAPLKWDGHLDDWTNDMEDRNVSPYTHAQPVVLSAENCVQGTSHGDADLSGIIYFLWNEKALLVAGVIFGSPPSVLRAQLGSHVVTMDVSAAGVAPRLDGNPVAPAQIAAGKTTSDQLIDTRALAFTQIDQRWGSLARIAQVRGTTFELELPWRVLGLEGAADGLPALLQLEREHTVLQAPVGAAPDQPAAWLGLRMSSAP